MSVSYCHTHMSLCHIHITMLIRLQLDNNNVNKLTMIAITINICKLIHTCEQRSAEQYMLTNIINKTKYILLQCKYEVKWII
jgi:hypothetical protein